MKRTYSSYLVDLLVLEPLLAIVLMMLAVIALKGTFATPDVSVDLAVGLLFGGATTVMLLLGLWAFVYIRLPKLAIGGLSKASWAIALLLLAPFALPIFYWRYLRHEFASPSPPERPAPSSP